MALKQVHGEIYNASQIHRAAINQHAKIEQRQCNACETQVQQQHTCPVVMQLAVLKQWTLHNEMEMTPRTPETKSTTGLVDLRSCGFNHKDWSGAQQHDSAEYVTVLLEYFKPPRYHHAWEKRVMIGNKGDTLEVNESRAPVVVQVEACRPDVAEGLGCSSTPTRRRWSLHPWLRCSRWFRR